MASCNKSASPRLPGRGFNLVESAIVLGVVGLVIGGIWAAANSVQTEHKANQVMTGIMRAADMARPLLNAYVTEHKYGNIEDMTRTLFDGKLDGFSGDALDIWGGNAAIGTPLGSGTSFIVDSYGDAAIWPDFYPYSFTIAGVPKSMCYRLLHKTASVIAADMGAQNFVGMFAGDASGSFLGAYMPPPFNTNDSTRTTARFDNEDTMCGQPTLTLTFFFRPNPQ